MKKVLYTLMAGALLASCVEESDVRLDLEKASAPVLPEFAAESYELKANENVATVKFTPADYGMAAAVRYTLYADLSNEFAKEKKVGSVDTPASEITIAGADLNNALISLGCSPAQEIEVFFRMKSEMRGESAGVGGELVSNVISGKFIPYNAEKAYAKIWVVGSYCSWNHANSLFLYNYEEDDEKYEAVVDFGAEHADNQFKITGEAGWNNGNWGVANAADLGTAERARIQLADGSNDNITCYTANRYYNFTFSKSSLLLTKVKGFDQVGIIGLNGDWDNDIVMTLDSKQRFYADIEASANTEFKFRLDSDWGTNWGVDGALGGGNIPIEAGQYRIYLDLNNFDKVTYSISAEDYGKQEGGDGDGDVEDPLPEGAEPVNVICADPGWDSANLYGWGMKTSFTWPGLEMSKATLGGKAYWYYTLDKENWGSTGVGLIFNNGTVQTVDITVATLEGVKCFTLGEIVDGKYPYAEMAETERPVVKITYKNEAGWPGVSLYGWGEGCDFSLGDWPGSSMTKEGDFWTYSIPAENIGKSVKLIFNNNGGGAQTVDLGPFTLNQDWDFDNSNATIK